MTESTTYYRLAAGIDVVPIGDDAILFQSNTLAVKVEGSMGLLLGRRVVPLLERPQRLDDLAAQLADIPASTIQRGLESLADARVLKRTANANPLDDAHPLTAFVAEMGVDPDQAFQRLRALHVAVFGLEAHGAHLALELGRLGVGRLTLADSFPLHERDRLLLPASAKGHGSHQDVVAQLISEQAPDARVTVAGDLSREAVLDIARECTLLIGAFDRGFETAQHWLNRAAIAVGNSALFAEIRTHVAVIGPHVVPGQSACYMCYRMRRVACEENYIEAMAHEHFVNERRSPALSSRATATFLAAQVGSLMAGEVVKLVALGLPPTLAGRIMEIDSLTLETRLHPVLRLSECPVCGEKKKLRVNPSRRQLIKARESEPVGDLRNLGDRLISARTGVIRHVEAFAKDPVEPAIPYIVRADVANHRFLSKREDNGDVCSGKGLTLDDARVSAMGEAVERYSGAVHRADEVTWARRQELNERSIDPRALVLYHTSQYRDLPYAPYDDAAALGWVPARSLVRDDVVMVPALAVFMNYHADHDGEFLFPITSNGLAAGPTLLDAVWAAALEVMERDAFLIAWLNRLPARRYCAREHPDREIAQVAAAYARRGVDLRLFRMPTDHDVAVFASIAVEESGRLAGRMRGPAMVVGLGVDSDPVRASRKAVLEVCQVRPALRRRMRSPEAQQRLAVLLADPHAVATINDHDLLYAAEESLHRMAFWLDSPDESFEWIPRPPTSVADQLEDLTDWLDGRGGDLLYVNLTPPEMAELGLYTARVILPEFQPIDFGWKERRLGGTRLYTLPANIGLRSMHVGLDELNDDPHPLA